ncbi:MAG: SURF1 family protein [Hyphomicrobiaceae bacterium]
MLHRLREAGLIIPTLASILGLGVLLSLGVWQMQRKAWKDGLVAKITSRAKGAPVQFEDALRRFNDRRDDVDYLPVKVTGKMDHDGEIYFYAPHPKLGPGVHVYTPLQYAPDKVVWLNRGFVKKANLDRDKRRDSLPLGEVSVTGLARLSPSKKSSMFVPENDLEKRQFYWRDLSNMHATAYDKDKVSTVAFFIDVAKDGQPPTTHGPHGGVTRLQLTNRHFEYAITWFGLAVTLLVVFALFARGRLQSDRSPGNTD